MAADSDDDYDSVSDWDMSESEDENELSQSQETPLTAPQTPRSIRPSELKTIPCPYEACRKSFNRQARLDEHLRSHTNNRIFKCPTPTCSKDFLRSSHLKRHLKTAHSNVRDYKCSWDGCDKSFATGTRLKRHEEAHKGREKFQCKGYDHCNATFRKHDTLRRHIISVHEHMRPFPCTEVDAKTGKLCPQAFETAEKLRSHQRNKHDKTKFACTLCLEQATVVMGTEDLDPSHCLDTYFATYAELKSHIATVHPPTCDFCPTSFTTVKELSRHLELQHGLADPDSKKSKTEYFCTFPDCSRSFSKRGNLNVHMKTVHEKRKDFVCGQSEVTLAGEMTFEAPLHGCGRDFTSKATLEEHIRTAHLGLESKRLEREKRRRDERGDDLDEEFQPPKTRKPRKDKGERKISALATLLGEEPSRSRGQSNFATQEDIQDDIPPAMARSVYLSGSVTMYGSQMYHHDSGHHDHSLPVNPLVGLFGDDNQNENVVNRNNNYDDEDDFMFEGFEHDITQRYDITPVDPFLFQH